MKLNLGCSDGHVQGYVNVDICEPADMIVDLRQRWPWDDSSIEEIRAHDIFEHLPDKVHTLNETYRVLKPRGILNLIVPTTEGRGAWQDPTHVSFWNPNSLFYLEYRNPHNTRFRKAYGLHHQFIVLEKEHLEYSDKVWKLHAKLQAVK